MELLFLRAPSIFVFALSDSPLLLQSNSLFSMIMLWFAWWMDAVAHHLYITHQKYIVNRFEF